MPDFKTTIEKRLKEATYIQVLYFSLMCAMRALPFLGTSGDFNFWKKYKRMEYLHHILYAIDAITYKFFSITHTGHTSDRQDNISKIANSLAAAAAYDAVNDNAAYDAAAFAAYVAVNDNAAYDAAAFAAYVANNAAYVAANAANAAFAAANVAANANVAVNDSATYAATSTATAASNLGLNFKHLIEEDLKHAKKGQFIFHHDLSIYDSPKYKNIWNNFMTALRNENCGYWADLYTKLFNNGLNLSDGELDELKKRIHVPSEIKAQGAAAVASYMENAHKQGTVFTRRETRLIILGSAGAGKTTLAWRLNGDWSYPAPEDSTHGVDTNIELQMKDIKTRVWDFGGQIIYHSSHRCFMYANCVYILVINARRDDNRDFSRIKYWLDTISIYSEYRAKVFIVINESDNRKQDIRSFDSLKKGEYEHMIEDIVGFNIGNDRKGITDLLSRLASHIENTGYQAFGKKDSDAMRELNDLFHAHNKKVLERDEFEKILIDNNITTEIEKSRTKELFNTLGVAFSYSFMKGYVLDPYWISHGIYKIIDHLQKNKSIFIKDNELIHIFADELNNYPIEQHKYILDLMEYHKIGFREKGGIRGLFVPCAASFFKPDEITYDIEPDNIVFYIERNELEEFPADFFYRYIIANKEDVKVYDNTLGMWQTGIVLEKRRSSALIEITDNRRIKITVWGHKKKEYFDNLELLIHNLLKEYHFTPHEQIRRNIAGKDEKTILLISNAVGKGIFSAAVEATTRGGVFKIIDLIRSWLS